MSDPVADAGDLGVDEGVGVLGADIVYGSDITKVYSNMASSDNSCSNKRAGRTVFIPRVKEANIEAQRTRCTAQ